MKITIEFEVKNEYEAEKLRKYSSYINNPDWLASWWSVSDVHSMANTRSSKLGWNSGSDEAEEITDEEAREVLRLADKYHDCEQGINWEVLDSWVDHVKGLRKEIA